MYLYYLVPGPTSIPPVDADPGPELAPGVNVPDPVLLCEVPGPALGPAVTPEPLLPDEPDFELMIITLVPPGPPVPDDEEPDVVLPDIEALPGPPVFPDDVHIVGFPGPADTPGPVSPPVPAEY